MKTTKTISINKTTREKDFVKFTTKIDKKGNETSIRNLPDEKPQQKLILKPIKK